MSAVDQILSYDFDSDGEFTAGVQSILSSQPQASAEERDTILTKARLYYFNQKTGLNVNLDEYIQKLQVDREQQKPDVEHTLSVPALAAPAAPTATATTAAEQNTDKSESSEGTEVTERVLTFAEIKHLIETDQTHLIPNNKVIPDELNDASPSVSVAQIKRKPWETAQATVSNPPNDG